MDALHLCRADAIGEGRSRGFDPHGIGSDTVFLVRFRGQLHAWRDACPHVDGAPMAWRKDAYLNAAGTRITCHAHGAQFEPDTGACISGPCIGRSLQRVAIEIDAQGEVHAAPHLRAEETEKWQR